MCTLGVKRYWERYFVCVYVREDDCFQVWMMYGAEHSRQPVNVLLFYAKTFASHMNICSRASQYRLSAFKNDRDAHSSPP